jgi:hypothetical protein
MGFDWHLVRTSRGGGSLDTVMRLRIILKSGDFLTS